MASQSAFESDVLDTFRHQSKASLEGPGGTPDQADASIMSYSCLLTEELQQIMGQATGDESELITLADIEIEEKAPRDDSSIMSIQKELYIESRRQASTVIEEPQMKRLQPNFKRLNNYVINEEDSENGVVDQNETQFKLFSEKKEQIQTIKPKKTSEQVNISHLINDLKDFKSLELIRQESGGSQQIKRVDPSRLKFVGKKNVSFKPKQLRENNVSGSAEGADDYSGMIIAAGSSETNSSKAAVSLGNKSLVINMPNNRHPQPKMQIMIKTPTNAFGNDISLTSGSSQKFSGKSIKISKQRFQSVLGPQSKSPEVRCLEPTTISQHEQNTSNPLPA